MPSDLDLIALSGKVACVEILSLQFLWLSFLHLAFGWKRCPVHSLSTLWKIHISQPTRCQKTVMGITGYRIYPDINLSGRYPGRSAVISRYLVGPSTSRLRFFFLFLFLIGLSKRRLFLLSGLLSFLFSSCTFCCFCLFVIHSKKIIRTTKQTAIT